MKAQKNLGKVLKIARIANDYKMNEVPELIQVSQGHISVVERGQKSVSVKTFEKFAKAYNLAPYQLMELVEYYESLECDELRKYQLTLFKTLEILVSKSN